MLPAPATKGRELSAGHMARIWLWGSLCGNAVLSAALVACLAVHLAWGPARCWGPLRNETSGLEGPREGAELRAALAEANRTLRETLSGWESCQTLTAGLRSNLTALHAELSRKDQQLQDMQQQKDQLEARLKEQRRHETTGSGGARPAPRGALCLLAPLLAAPRL